MKKIIVLMLILTSISCSRLGVAVDWADEYILNEADNYFDLSSEQYKEFKPRVEKDIQRIKKENFPELSIFFRKISEKAEKNQINEKEIIALFDEGQGLFRKVLHQFEPTILDFATKATSEQANNFIKEYNKKIEELQDDIKTPSDRLKKQKKRYDRWLNEFIDNMTADQKKALEAEIENNPIPFDLQVKSRNQIRDKFLTVMGNPQELKNFLTNFEKQRSPEYQEALKKYQSGLKSYLWVLFQSLSEGQKTYLIKQLRHRADELEKISKT